MPTADSTRMRAIKVFMLASCVVLGGCLEFEQTITLQPDGSGTQILHMVVRDSVLAEIERATPAARLGESANPKAVFDKDLVGRELAAAGLELTSHEVASDAGRRTVDLAVAFADFATLQKSPLCGSGAEWLIEKGPRPGTATLTLYPQGKQAWQQARQKAEAMEGEPDPLVEDFFRTRQRQLAGLDIVLRFRVPGDVLVWTANMEKTGEREVTARIAADQIKTPQDLVRRLAPRFQVIFDATGCSLID